MDIDIPQDDFIPVITAIKLDFPELWWFQPEIEL
jgi:hypothetical protein